MIAETIFLLPRKVRLIIITSATVPHNMPGVTGHGILSRVRSQRKLRTAIAAEELETPKLTIPHRRQHSDGAPVTPTRSTRSASRRSAHWPPIEFDPLKLNPPSAPLPPTTSAPARLHERQPLQCPRTTKRSFASVENRRPPRLLHHHSDSGFPLFDLGDTTTQGGGEKEESAMPIVDRNRQREVDIKGWPSPAGSVDSDKSWFDYDDDEDDDEDEDDDDDEDGETIESHNDAPMPRRRPPVGSPDDPTNFIKRGEWKRRGIFFGLQAQEVATKHDEAFEV